MTDRLSLYNSALLNAGERSLVSLTEEREPRRLLDQVWSDGVLKYCLEQGQWHFAMRTVKLDYDPAIVPQFGLNRAFTKPNDWVLTSALCSDEFFRNPLTRCWDESGYWYADVDNIYVRYVSNDVAYGGDLSKWPESFKEFVGFHIATKIILKTTNDESKLKFLMAAREKWKKEAKGRAAMAEPTSFPARGNWSNSRNRFPNRRDLGNTSGNLY